MAKRRKPATKKRIKTVTVQINNAQSLIDLMDQAEAAELFEQRAQLMSSAAFSKFLSESPPINFDGYKVPWTAELYRICAKPTDPRDPTGSAICGGRLNIGGSQLRTELASLSAFGVVYTSEDYATAHAEYTDSGNTPLGPRDTAYRMTLKKTLVLWDLDKVIGDIEYPNLKSSVESAPMYGQWRFCKVPLFSQILAHWLKALGGDGIIFKSTKNGGNRNIVIFARDTTESKKFFKKPDIV